jgi:hypothetical protein
MAASLLHRNASRLTLLIVASALCNRAIVVKRSNGTPRR